MTRLRKWIFHTFAFVQLPICFLHSSIAAAIVGVLKRFDTIVSFFISLTSNIFQVQLELTLLLLYNSPQKVLFAPFAQIIGCSKTQNWKMLYTILSFLHIKQEFPKTLLKGALLSCLSRGWMLQMGDVVIMPYPITDPPSSTIQNPYHHHYPEYHHHHYLMKKSLNIKL